MVLSFFESLITVIFQPVILALIAFVLSAPKARGMNRFDRLTVFWNGFEVLTYVFVILPHLLLSSQGPIRDRSNLLSRMWLEFGYFDQRWILGDPLIKAAEVFALVVLVPGFCLVVHAVLKKKPYRTALQMAICFCELNSIWILLCTEWFEGAPNLSLSPPYWAFYLIWVFSNLIQLCYCARCFYIGGNLPYKA